MSIAIVNRYIIVLCNVVYEFIDEIILLLVGYDLLVPGNQFSN